MNKWFQNMGPNIWKCKSGCFSSMIRRSFHLCWHECVAWIFMSHCWADGPSQRGRWGDLLACLQPRWPTWPQMHWRRKRRRRLERDKEVEEGVYCFQSWQTDSLTSNFKPIALIYMVTINSYHNSYIMSMLAQKDNKLKPRRGRPCFCLLQQDDHRRADRASCLQSEL